MEREAFTHTGKRFLLAPGLGASMVRVRGLQGELAPARSKTRCVLIAGEKACRSRSHTRGRNGPPITLIRVGGQPPPLTAALGIADDGRRLLIRLSPPEAAHILVAGATGSRKTEWMRTIVLSLALSRWQSDLQLALIDPKVRG